MMSGFHPVLGLLAVAVCISYAEGAPFSVVQNDDITAHQPQNQDFHKSAQLAREDGPPPSALNNMKNNIANRADTQGTKVIEERNYEIINKAADFQIFDVLRSKGQNAVLTKAEARKSGSGRVDEDAVEGDGVLHEEERSDSVEEDCEEEDENNGESTITTTPTVTTIIESEPTEPEEECESEEGSGSSTSESSPSTTQNPETQQTEDGGHTTPTETTQRTTKKPRDPNRSSGSFHESDSEGVEFSNSVSRESFGQSTEFDY